jgi:hypothetical protein
MMPQFFEPGIGVVFDLGEIRSRNPKAEAKGIFMRAADIAALTGCNLLAGPTRTAEREKSQEFIVAAYGANLRPEIIRSWFESSSEPGLAPPDRRFIEKPDLNSQPIEIFGSILPSGHYETPGWSQADHQLCRESGWCYKPGRIPAAIPTAMRRELERWANRDPLASQSPTLTGGALSQHPAETSSSWSRKIKSWWKKKTGKS